MSFFRNDAINRVNLHSGVQALAQGAGQLFLLAFLLRNGFSISAALLAQASIVAGRFVIRPVVLPLAKRWGLKPLLIAGAASMAAQYPLLAEVHGVGFALVGLCAAAALGEVLYYVSYNATFAALGDAEFRGRQVAFGQLLVASASVVAPLLGAWALLTVGPRWTFAGVAGVQLLSAAPLLGLPNVAVKRSAPGAWRAARPAALLTAIDGWFDACFLWVWQIDLFVLLNESYRAYGGVMALAGLAGAAFGLIFAGHIDAGRGRWSVAIAYGAAGGVVALRAASLASPWLAAATNALGAVVMPTLVPPLATATYAIAKESPCPLRVQMTTEAGWDLGSCAACLAAAGLARLNAPPWVGVMLALPAVGAGARLLWRFYAPRV